MITDLLNLKLSENVSVGDAVGFSLNYSYPSVLKRSCSKQSRRTKKWSCLVRISSVNVAKSGVSCGFGNI